MCKFIAKRTLSFLLIAAGLTACSGDNDISHKFTVPSVMKSNSPSNPMAQQVYNTLLGELYNHYGDTEESLAHYMKVVEVNSSVDVAKRVTELSSRSGDNKTAMVAAQQWVKLSKDSVDAHQYLALLNIRAGNAEAAAKELLWIQQYLDKKKGHGFAFVASLVSFEANKDVAFKAFKLFAKQSKNPSEAGLALAALAINAGNYDEVLEAIEESRKSKDQRINDQAHLYYAKAMMNLEREKEAVKVLTPIVKESESSDLKLEYARLLILSGEHERAHKLFDQLYKAYPDNIDILYTLGLLYIDLKQFDKAKPLFERLSKMKNLKKSGEAHYFLGKIYEAQENYDDALVAYGKAENTGFYQEAEVSKARLIFKGKGLQAARNYLKERIDNAEDTDETVSLLLVDGQLLYEAKQYKESLVSYDKVLSLKPDDFEGLYSRSLVYSQIGDIKRAEVDLKKILKTTPDNVTALNALGYSLAIYTTRFDEAKEYISKALNLQPDDPAIIDSMGWIEYRTGNLEEAEKLLRRAYKSFPDPEVASHLIEVLSESGKVREAQTLLDAMLAKHPDDEKLMTVKKKISQVDAAN